jgi:hypothetical protein
MDFADSPTVDDTYEYGPASYIWTGDRWKRGTGTFVPTGITITELIPNTLEIGDIDTPVSFIGTNFTPNTIIVFDGVEMTPLFISSTHLRDLIELQGNQVPRTVQVTAKNGTEVATPSLPFTYTDTIPDLRVTEVLPPTGEIGSPDLHVRVLGENFNQNCAVGWEFAGYTISTDYISPTELTCDVAMVGRPRTIDVWVRDLSIGKNSINSMPFTYLDQVTLKLTQLIPSQGTIGQPSLLVRLLGEQFTTSSMVTWDGVDVATTFVSASELEVSIPMTGAARTVQVTVHNGSLVSNALPFGYIADTGVLTLTQLVPPEITIPNTVVVSVQGTGFNPPGHINESQLYWNNAIVPSSYISSVELRVTINSTGETEREVPVSVININGPTSNSIPFQYNNAPLPPTVTRLEPDSITQGGQWEVDIQLYGTNFQAMSVVSFNGVDVAEDKTDYLGPQSIRIHVYSPVTDADDSVPVTVRNDTLVSNVKWMWCPPAT